MATVNSDMCTSDARARIMTLAKAYNRKLSSKFLTGIPPECLPKEDSSVGNAALALSKFAFATPRQYFFVADDMIPTQCLHLDIISAAKIESIESQEEFASVLQVALKDPSALLWSFASQEIDRNSFNTAPHLDTILKVGSLLNNVSQTAICHAVSALGIQFLATPSNVQIFGDATMPRARVFGRLLFVMYLLLPSFPSALRSNLAQSLNTMYQSGNDIAVEVGTFLSNAGPDVSAPLIQLVTQLQEDLESAKDIPQSAAIVAQTLQNLASINGFHHPEPVPHTLFYAPGIISASEDDIKNIFVDHLEKRFSLIKYPALLDAAAKCSVLQLQGIVDNNGAHRQALIASLFSRTSMRDYFLCLNVRRNDIVNSTLLEIQRNLARIHCPLRVTFVGEDGIDEGGVRKEFFQLLCKELLSLDYGMFQATPGGHAIWPVSDVQNNENRREFWLIGMVIGLAVFNNVILDVRFPSALFKKLLRIEPSFVDLADLDPELARGLTQLLEFEETPEATVHDTFARTFTYEYEHFGAKMQDELCPDGADVVLTAANRTEYVRLLTRHLLTQSIYSNFEEFRKGFDQVCDREIVRKMHPKELELLICGNPVLDFKALEESTTYDGFDPKDPTIRYFWEIVHGFNDESKRNFLRFCTGSDRVPIRGLSDLKFVIGKNGGDGDLLPTSHTCFNHLLLPVYANKETLEKKLLLAIYNCHGFGLR